MPAIVTTGGSITCANQGVATLSSSAKLTVNGQAVILAAAVPSFASGLATTCTFVTPNGTKTPCTTLSVSSGQSVRLTASSQPVLLSSATIVTDEPPPSTPATVVAGQFTVTAS